jgi:hypothetical protein
MCLCVCGQPLPAPHKQLAVLRGRCLLLPWLRAGAAASSLISLAASLPQPSACNRNAIHPQCVAQGEAQCGRKEHGAGQGRTVAVGPTKWPAQPGCIKAWLQTQGAPHGTSLPMECAAATRHRLTARPFRASRTWVGRRERAGAGCARC